MTVSTVIVVLAVLASAAHGCDNKWTGAACNVCPAPYAGPLCNACLPGFSYYPNCTKCDIAWCGGATQATGAVPYQATGQVGKCVCTCANMFIGSRCQTCATGYTGAACDTCDNTSVQVVLTSFSDGGRMYPSGKFQCRACRVELDCYDHAESVFADTQTTCACKKCRNKWTGPNCFTCPSQFASGNCDKCANGGHYIAGPYVPGEANCQPCMPFNRLSTTDTSYCSGSHTPAVAGVWPKGTYAIAASVNNYGVCVCRCANMFTGPQCRTCLAPATGVACDTCANTHVKVTGEASFYLPGLGYYPSMLCRLCSILTDCNNHATAVTPGPTGTTCACTCRNKWINVDGAAIGPIGSIGQCAWCPPPFKGWGGDCNSCAIAGAVYPNCNSCAITTLVYPDCTAPPTAAPTVAPTPAPTADPKKKACSQMCGEADLKYKLLTGDVCICLGRNETPKYCTLKKDQRTFKPDCVIPKVGCSMTTGVPMCVALADDDEASGTQSFPCKVCP